MTRTNIRDPNVRTISGRKNKKCAVCIKWTVLNSVTLKVYVVDRSIIIN